MYLSRQIIEKTIAKVSDFSQLSEKIKVSFLNHSEQNTNQAEVRNGAAGDKEF